MLLEIRREFKEARILREGDSRTQGLDQERRSDGEGGYVGKGWKGRAGRAQEGG